MQSLRTTGTRRTHTVLNVATTGTNGTSVQTTYGVQIANTHAGTTSPTNELTVVSATGIQANFASSGTNTGSIVIDNAAAGNQSNVTFNDTGSPKWQIGKQSDNTFFIWDQAHTQNFLQVNASGNIILEPTSGTVGMGTTLPATALDVGTGTVTAQAYRVNSLGGAMLSSRCRPYR
jgi:hypothetical protein